MIVDEAHTIKNRAAKMSQACCDLSGQYRWCLTGTPYQNTVDDIYSLIRFLRIPPFCDWPYWRDRITSEAESGKMTLALTRIRTLLRAIMLRRTKDVLKVCSLPCPHDQALMDRTGESFYRLGMYFRKNWNLTLWNGRFMMTF